jgi:hypothetical protein
MKPLHQNRLSAVWSRPLLTPVLAGLAISSILASAFALRLGDDKEGSLVGEVQGSNERARVESPHRVQSMLLIPNIPRLHLPRSGKVKY